MNNMFLCATEEWSPCTTLKHIFIQWKTLCQNKTNPSSEGPVSKRFRLLFALISSMIVRLPQSSSRSSITAELALLDTDAGVMVTSPFSTAIPLRGVRLRRLRLRLRFSIQYSYHSFEEHCSDFFRGRWKDARRKLRLSC